MSFILSYCHANWTINEYRILDDVRGNPMKLILQICSWKSSVGGIDINVLVTENAVDERVNGWWHRRHCRRFWGCRSLSPIENRYRHIIKVLVLLATFARYRGAENAGRIMQGGGWQRGKMGRFAEVSGKMELINSCGELNFQHGVCQY